MRKKATQPRWFRLPQTEHGSWTGPGWGPIPARIRRRKWWRRRLSESRREHSFLRWKKGVTEEDEAEEELEGEARRGLGGGTGSEGGWRFTGLGCHRGEKVNEMSGRFGEMSEVKVWSRRSPSGSGDAIWPTWRSGPATKKRRCRWLVSQFFSDTRRSHSLNYACAYIRISISIIVWLTQ